MDGLELAVLRGARRTILRDLPVITVEVEVWKDPGYTARLLDELSSLHYEAWLVEESVGWIRADCRNLIAFPSAYFQRRRRVNWAGVRVSEIVPAERRWRYSSTLALAVASRRLLAVTNQTIEHLAYPCCARGRECCPGVGVCCSPKLVHAWLAHNVAHGGHDLQWYTRSQWVSNGLYTARSLDHAWFAEHLLGQMRLPANESGFDAHVNQPGTGIWASCYNGSCYSPRKHPHAGTILSPPRVQPRSSSLSPPSRLQLLPLCRCCRCRARPPDCHRAATTTR